MPLASQSPLVRRGPIPKKFPLPVLWQAGAEPRQPRAFHSAKLIKEFKRPGTRLSSGFWLSCFGAASIRRTATPGTSGSVHGDPSKLSAPTVPIARAVRSVWQLTQRSRRVVLTGRQKGCSSPGARYGKKNAKTVKSAEAFRKSSIAVLLSRLRSETSLRRERRRAFLTNTNGDPVFITFAASHRESRSPSGR
jgi:hypothetical protein